MYDEAVNEKIDKNDFRVENYFDISMHLLLPFSLERDFIDKYSNKIQLCKIMLLFYLSLLYRSENWSKNISFYKF